MNLNVDSIGLACVESRKEVVIIPKAQYDAMKQALEMFGDERNWYWLDENSLVWQGKDDPCDIIQKTLEAMK